MAKAISTIVAGLLLASAHANAGVAGCNASIGNISPFYCHLERIELARLQLEGSAAVLGTMRPDLEQIMRQRLEKFLTVLPRHTAGATLLAASTRPPQGKFSCTLWTVGRDASIALFVECVLHSATSGDSVDARLLGRTSEAEFDMAVRIALGRVVSKVTSRFKAKRERLVALSTQAGPTQAAAPKAVSSKAGSSKAVSSKAGNARIRTAGPAR